MRLTEIATTSRKVIKNLQNLYIGYSLDTVSYTELMKYLYQCYQSQDSDIIKEANTIKDKLKDDLLRLLSK